MTTRREFATSSSTMKLQLLFAHSMPRGHTRVSEVGWTASRGRMTAHHLHIIKSRKLNIVVVLSSLTYNY